MTDPNADQTLETWQVKVTADTSDVDDKMNKMTTTASQFSKAFGSALDILVIKGKSFSDVLKTLGQSLSQIALNTAFKPLENQLGNLFGNLVPNSGGTSALTNLLGGTGGALPFANGGVFSRGLPVPFASGGVIASPINFPLADGNMGLAGERGPEAIMPLTRGSDGRLGVGTSGGGGTNVTFNIATPDVDGFSRSQSQIAAALSRVVSQGNRNL